MAFRITQTPTYKVKIFVEIPNEQGKFDKSDFLAEFKRADLSQLNELRELPQKEVMEQMLVGWSGLLDDANSDVPFNVVNRDMLLLIPQAMQALVEGFWSSVFKAREKN